MKFCIYASLSLPPGTQLLKLQNLELFAKQSTIEKRMPTVQKYEFLPLLSSMLFAVPRVKASISELCQELWSVIAWPSIDLALSKLLDPGDKAVERLKNFF